MPAITRIARLGKVKGHWLRLGCGSLAPLLLLGCGGEEKERLAADSYEIPEDAPPVDCDAEALLPIVTTAPTDGSGYRVLLRSGDFDVSTGWTSSVDSSPSPATAPRSIRTTCPRDSRYDCCVYSDLDDDWRNYEQAPDTLSDLVRDRVAREKEEQQGYRCATFSGDPVHQFVAALGGQLGNQPIVEPDPSNPAREIGQRIACKKDQPPGNAMHVRGARFTDWGAQVYLDLTSTRNGQITPFDASSFDGVSFWMRLGEGGTQPVGHSLFVIFDDKFTKEQQTKYQLEVDAKGNYVLEPGVNGLPTPVYVRDAAGAPIPVKTATKETASNCYDVPVDPLKCDRFGAGVGLEKEWHFFKIPFSAMRQRGYGMPSPAGRLMVEEMLDFGLYMDIGNWDFWIDQVAYYKDPVTE